jgi:tetratricopeptide (TPR) repeat protein
MKTRKTSMLIILFGVTLLSVSALATTWAPAEKIDPITGQKIKVKEIMSYGSYIYNWPSKYHLVFWPLTDQNFIWFSDESGYAAFGNDFEKLNKEQKDQLAGWLKENYNPANQPVTHIEKLHWLEKVYAQRNMDDDFWCRFYRLMAYTYQDDEMKSIQYVKKAFPLLEKKLKRDPSWIERIESLYLLGDYSRQMGKIEEAKKYFEQVKKEKFKDQKGQERVGHPYFLQLVKDREELMK